VTAYCDEHSGLQVSAVDVTNSSSALLRQGRHLAPVNKNTFYVVPNIVHFIWFSNSDDRKMSFINYISIRSAHRIQKPDQILFHCNRLPVGYWWDRLWREVRIPVRAPYQVGESTSLCSVLGLVLSSCTFLALYMRLTRCAQFACWNRLTHYIERDVPFSRRPACLPTASRHV